MAMDSLKAGQRGNEGAGGQSWVLIMMTNCGTGKDGCGDISSSRREREKKMHRPGIILYAMCHTLKKICAAAGMAQEKAGMRILSSPPCTHHCHPYIHTCMKGSLKKCATVGVAGSDLTTESTLKCAKKGSAASNNMVGMLNLNRGHVQEAAHPETKSLP